MRALITRKIPSIAKELLEKKYSVDVNESNRPLSKKDAIEAVQNYDAILFTVADSFPADVIEQSKNLKILSGYSIGLNNIALDAAKQMGIAVFNIPDLITEPTADLTLALLLAASRRIVPANAYVKAGKWGEWDPALFCGEGLQGKTLGIIGMGRIGQAVAKRAEAFGINIVFTSRSEKKIPYEQVGLEKLLQVSDFITLHAPLTKETRGLLDLAKMEKMEKSPILVNMARGELIKTADLVTALKKGFVRAAALDVTDPEPLPGDHPLVKLDNCIIVPHIGGATLECRESMARRAAENILNHK
ncbi:MAG: D-glycerate dehydrogenase [Candidatus Algichlamydia australiensis]|nr:D-glycerate dehydrogenase [Chlamydiales bacterium]